MRKRPIGSPAAALLTVASLAASAVPGSAQSAPLAPFDRLVGGEWRSGQTVQVFEWGPGRASVLARSFTMQGGERVPTSVGLWYWHRARRTIVGVASAVGMPVELFEYTTEFDGDLMRSDLVAYDASGEPGRYVETMEFIDDDGYHWRLLLPRPDATEVVMSATFRRTGR